MIIIHLLFDGTYESHAYMAPILIFDTNWSKSVTYSRRKFIINASVAMVFIGLRNFAFAEKATKDASRYALIHDETRCNGCNLCVSICHKLHHIPKNRARLAIARIPVKTDSGSVQNHFFRHSCQHCEDAPCIEVCPTNASYRDNNGIVRIDTAKCIGCSYCISACPYQVRYLDPQTQVADKCDFCAETRLAKGLIPICVKVCPENALIFGKEDSPAIRSWIKENKFYQYQLSGAGKPHIYRLARMPLLMEKNV